VFTDWNARRRDFAIRVEISAKAASSTLVGVDVANWSFDLDLLDALTTEKSYQYRKPLPLHGKGILPAFPDFLAIEGAQKRQRPHLSLKSVPLQRKVISNL
jgi:hypothetical protein